MTEFWEANFIEKREIWGFEPAQSALVTKDFFTEKDIKNMLIPGIGYGRNAHIFKQSGIDVTGIEISRTAIELAKKHYGTDMVIHHGSVLDMPFDSHQYGGIFCYGLIHLLDNSARTKLISDCYNQLSENGYMVFTAITKEAHIYGQGKKIGKDRFEMFGGVKMFFYDRASIKEEFGKYGLFEVMEITENYPFYLIKCKKANTGNFERQ